MSKAFFVALAILAVSDFISDASTNSTMEGMVHRGKPIDQAHFPFAVLLRFKVVHPRTCGASLIMVQIVITAATCMEEFYHKDGLTMAYLGNIEPRHATVVRKVVNFRAHPKFKRSRTTNNVAVGFLDRPVVFGATVKKILLPGSKDFASDGMIGFGIGWGKLESIRPPDDVLNRKALGTQQRVISEEECERMLHIKIVHEFGTMAFCAIPSIGSFQVDEIGSGLAFRTSAYNYLGGVLSYVDKRSRVCVFTAVIDKEWIKKVILQLYDQSCDSRHH